MMAGRDKVGLEAWYQEAVQVARSAVAATYQLEDVPGGDPDFPLGTVYRELWRVHVQINRQEHAILCAIPPTFPDRFPAIYICGADIGQWGELPHVDDRRFLCTFDQDSVQINADQPAGLILAVIERAISILEKGIQGRNSDDYADEFKAYWDKNARGKVLSLVEPSESSRLISRLRLNPLFRGFSTLFADTRAQGEQWLANAGYVHKVKGEEALYLPLASFGKPPFPRTNAELSERVSVSGGNALDALHGYLRGRPRPNAVLASVEIDDGQVMLAWEHPIYRHEVQGKSGRRNVLGGVPGFQNGNCPPDKELTQLNAAGQLSRMSVERIDPQRLFQRTAGHDLETADACTAVIGCGSLGGFVADSLVRAGISKSLTLIDPQFLRPENVWRHYCGMNNVGAHKTKAVSSAVRAHFPHVDMRTFEHDALDLLASEPNALRDCSLVINTAGVFAVDRRLNDLFQYGLLGCEALCLMWVEVGLVAGHALLLFPGQVGCFECLLDKENLRYQHRAILDPGSLGMREPGCQTSYQPYGAVDLNSFVSGATRFLAKHKNSGRNLRYAWYGDLDAMRMRGIALNENLEHAESFSEEVEAIGIFPGCPVCQAK